MDCRDSSSLQNSNWVRSWQYTNIIHGLVSKGYEGLLPSKLRLWSPQCQGAHCWRASSVLLGSCTELSWGLHRSRHFVLVLGWLLALGQTIKCFIIGYDSNSLDTIYNLVLLVSATIPCVVNLVLFLREDICHMKEVNSTSLDFS